MPAAEGGDWDQGCTTTSPLPVCLPGSPAFLCSVPLRWARAAAPTPGAAGSKPEGRGFPGASTEEVACGGCSAPHVQTGLAFYERQVGGQTGLGSGTRGRLALVESELSPPSKPRTAQPDQAPGRSPGVGVRLRKRKPLAAPTSRQKALTKSCAVPLSGMVSGPPGGMGSGARARCFPKL